ncbi:MAG: C10 family peptidase [Muribaculaceae bacterium]|nr:C10 family peptidase [Muribaculaceae bacterium]
MRNILPILTLTALLLSACQSYEPELSMSENKVKRTQIEEIEPVQITDDVNSVEVNNILVSLFGNERKSRSEEYTISLLKDKNGIDRMICINYAGNGGFALISAEKTHSPILAYAEDGNFTMSDELPFPLSEWMECAMRSIAESETFSVDSLQMIAAKWRKYAGSVMPLDYQSAGSNMPWDEYYALTRIVMDKMAEWSSQGYRYYPIDDYNGTTSLGDKNGIATFVQSIMYPPYLEEYRNLTFVVEKDINYTTGKGHWMNTEWKQTNGYNKSFETKPEKPEEHIPVGCGPLAVGQIMYAYKYPNAFDWSGMTISGEGNKITSDFLLDVFKNCQAWYEYYPDEPGKSGTYSYTVYLRDALQEYGYNCEYVSKVKASQLLNNPAIISSHLEGVKNDGSKTGGDHSWIVEGGLNIETHIQTEVWTFTNESEFACIHNELGDISSTTQLFYVNWGWGDGTKAYYNLDMMIPSHRNINSNTIKSAIINIKPNK